MTQPSELPPRAPRRARLPRLLVALVALVGLQLGAATTDDASSVVVAVVVTVTAVTARARAERPARRRPLPAAFARPRAPRRSWLAADHDRWLAPTRAPPLAA